MKALLSIDVVLKAPSDHGRISEDNFFPSPQVYWPWPRRSRLWHCGVDYISDVAVEMIVADDMSNYKCSMTVIV